MKHDQEWAEFITAIHARLEAGEREYGDGSFRKGQSKLVGEVLEELEDVCGWSFVLWCRVKKLTAKSAGRTEVDHDVNDVAPVLSVVRPDKDAVQELAVPRVGLDSDWIGFVPVAVALALTAVLWWAVH